MAVYIDAENMVAGRLASIVAKRLLNGEEIIIVNAEKAVISGNPIYNERFYRHKVDRGDPYHGPFYPRFPDRMLRRFVRGMLPWHKPRGRDAYRRLKVYISVPKEFTGQQLERPLKAENRLDNKYVTLGKLSEKVANVKV